MSVVSLQFLELIVVVTAVFFIIPKQYQWCVILAASLYFYCCSGWLNIIFLLATSGVSFLCAKTISLLNQERKDRVVGVSNEERKVIRKEIDDSKKKYLYLGNLFCLFTWIILKYANFMIGNINSIFHSNIAQVNWIIPLGISFFVFHEIGYVTDVYRGRYEAETSYLKYLTFVSFFAHIVQGPFSRYNVTGKSITAEHTFSYDRMCEGCMRILWGVFKKTVIADKIGIAVVSIFSAYRNYSGSFLLFAILGYSIQIYADFSGYMDIMCGICHILDIELAENFRQPYLARSVDEFWRRWHITLGAWFKDYVFYPLSIGKTGQKLGKWARKRFGARTGKLFPGYFAMLFVWAATGLWHGANWTFLVWGYVNLIVIMFSMQMEEAYEKAKERLHIDSDSFLWKLLGTVRTFFLVSFFRFFSTAPDLHTALSMIKRCLTRLNPADFVKPMNFFVNMTGPEIWFCLAGTVILIITDILKEREAFEEWKLKAPMLLRNLAITVLILAIILVAGGDNDLIGGFMYANF